MMRVLILRFRQVFAGGRLLLFLLASLVIIARPALADCATNPTEAGCPCALNSSSAICKDLENKDGLSNTIKNATNIVLFVAGALAVIMIIYGGIRYITAHGDEKQVKVAKDTIVYSVAGLIIAILAYALVTFIFDRFK